MQKPPLPIDEDERLERLRSLDVLDTAPEERFDRVTRLARRLFDVPIALVSLVDAERQWFKSRQGLDASETPREVSFCGHAILESEVFVVNDACEDPRFADNPLVQSDPEIRFYAGCPVRSSDGKALGTLCIIDRHRRELADHAMAVARRTDKPLVILAIDMDDFKLINDELGHATGDHALLEMAQLLRETFRDSDVVARIGGDEFAVLLTGSAEGEIARPLRTLEERVARRNAAPGAGYRLAYSLGACTFEPGRHARLGDLLDEADEQMYRAKRERKRRPSGGGTP